MKKMTKAAHKKRHVLLHRMLDELVADFMGHTGKMPSKTPIFELMEWSFTESREPTEKDI